MPRGFGAEGGPAKAFPRGGRGGDRREDGGALPLAAIGAARPENESDGKRAKPKALGSGPLVFRKPGLAGQHDENHVVVIPPNDAFHLQLPAQAQRALHLFA